METSLVSSQVKEVLLQLSDQHYYCDVISYINDVMTNLVISACSAYVQEELR